MQDPAAPDVTEIWLPDPAATERLAEVLSGQLGPGDLVFLHGDLGAGKTHLARRLVQTYLAQDIAVPSPTFTLVQPYEARRDDGTERRVLHADLYRLGHAEEVDELGLGSEAAADALVLVEWPERADGALGVPSLTVFLDTLPDNEGRRALISFDDSMVHGGADGAAGARNQALISAWARAQDLSAFLGSVGWGGATRREIAGDASTRRYERLEGAQGSAVLMDWPAGPDGPPIRDGKPYSQLVHLAESASQFMKINQWLRSQDLVAADILAADATAGFVLLEDLGAAPLDKMVRSGALEVDAAYFEAVETLCYLHACVAPADLPPDLPFYDADALITETELFLDWYLPDTGCSITPDARARWRALWHEILATIDAPSTLVLRDFHAPNIMWRAAAEPPPMGRWRLGLIDIQDAVIGHPAYDLISLLDDARVDVPPERRARLLTHYLDRRFGDDAAARADFTRASTILTAQRNLKIAGIFVRLDQRDGKPAYRQHVPRIMGYLSGALAQPALAPLRDWCATHTGIQMQTDA